MYIRAYLSRKMSSRYSSCNQDVKDEINKFLGSLVSERNNDTVVTLDDVDNGTCCFLRETGYTGHLSVVQRNRDIIIQQKRQFKALFGTTDKYTIQFGDIVQHYLTGAIRNT